MFSRLLATLSCIAPCAALAGAPSMPARTLEGPAPARVQFRAPALAASAKVALPAPAAQKLAADGAVEPGRPLRIGTVRELPESAPIDGWVAVSGGFVARLLATSDAALGLRVKLEVGALAPGSEVRVQGHADRVDSAKLDRAGAAEAWTPWTDGATQLVEVFSPIRPAAGAVRMSAIAHFTASPLEKAAGTCTISTMCTTGDAVLDAAIAERKKSVAKIAFMDGTGVFLCTGTLINTERFPAAYFMTANHCVSTPAQAASLTSFWFYEDTACGSGLANLAAQQTGSGAELVFTNFDVDSTLLKLTDTPPAGAVYAPWSRAQVAVGTPMVSISHPRGDTLRLATGSITEIDAGLQGYPQRFDLAHFSRGIIEGGSSGSGLFTLDNGSLVFRGTLFGTTVNNGPMSCTNQNEDAIYSRFDIFEQQADAYIRLVAQPPDDAPNRARDLFGAPFSDPNGFDKPLNERGGSTLAVDNLRIDYPGDLDVFRFRLTAPAWVNVWTEGAQDTMGDLLNSSGTAIVANDDWQSGAPYNFGIARQLPVGVYYVQVSHFEASGTGVYNLRMRADDVDTNYTDLWWNAAENGWGLNLNHQGNTLFATLYTYDGNGQPAWFSMSGGVKQADGSYLGDLVRTTGPAFNSAPWNPGAVGRAVVGSMRIAFGDTADGTVTYNVGTAQVHKAITRIGFATPPVCKWSASDRSRATNFQDLWWGGDAESGWGVNITHQGDVLFATLFTYDASGQPLWLVMSDGRRSASSATAVSYSGALYRTRGPAFNAVPFTPITAADNTQVGTMTFSFTDGNTGTLAYTVNGAPVTKSIHRLVFGPIKTQCSPG